ncbi:ATP-grasp domain-containing protein [Bacillus sp. AK128]
MKTIIFIETNKSGSSREAIRSAEKLGFYTVLFTKKKNFMLQREEFPDVHEMIFLHDILEVEMIPKIDRLLMQGKLIKGVISFVDPYVTLAMKMSNQYGIEGFTHSAIEMMEDKIQTRKALNDILANVEHLIFTPEDSIDELIENKHFQFPCIVKAPSSTGSKDVSLICNDSELKEDISRLQKKYENQPILLEEFIDGPQYLVETLVVNGEVEIIAIIEQEITKNERFIITGYYSVLDMDPSLLKDLEETLLAIVNKFGLNKGACHFELRLSNNTWKLIEVNPRISGGAMNSMIYYSYGINLVEETLKLFLSLPFDLTPKKKQYVYTYYLTIYTKGRLLKVTGKKRASQCEGVKEVFIKPRKGMHVYPPTSMGHRYGYLIIEADSKARAKELALLAAKEIKFYIEEQE